MQGAQPRQVPGEAELRTLGHPAGPDYSARVARAGIGEVVAGPRGDVHWSEATYRLHGRPRWRRVRTAADALLDVVDGAAALRAAYARLAGPARRQPDEPVRYVAEDEFGIRHHVLLVPVGQHTALVCSAGPAELPSRQAARPAATVPAPPTQPALPTQPTPSAPATISTLPTPPQPWTRPTVATDTTASRTRLAPPRPAPAQPEPTEPEPAHSEPAHSEPAHSEPAHSEPAQPEPAGTRDAATPDPVSPEPQSRQPGPGADNTGNTDSTDNTNKAGEAGDALDAGSTQPPTTDLEVEHSWMELLEASPVAMAVLDDQDRLAEVNDALCALTGRGRDELAALQVADLTDDSAAEHGEDVPLASRDGRTRWTRVAYSDVELDGRPRRLATFEDVTDAHEIETRLRQQALHDELTGLPNRRLLVEALTRALSRARRHAGKVGVFFVDVDDLKRVNDTHGHHGGDTLILTVGRGLRDALRESDVLARIGGDEFVAVCEDVGEGRTLDEIGQRIIHSVSRPLVLDGERVPVSISVGVAVPQSADEDAETLLARADAAMYRAKAAGGGRLWGGTGRWNTAIDNRPGVEDWVEAMRRGQLRMMYEPVVTAEDGVLLGVVGKLRWTHPEHGELTGTDLLETREAASATLPLLRWSVRKVLSEVRTLGDSPLRVWLTVPPRALLQASVADEIARAYTELGGRRAPSLVLDVRERDLAALLSRGGPPDTVERLTSAGPVSLGIDGFRGDAVPLGLLPQLALRSLRLHPSLLRTAARTDDPAGRALLDGIVAAATAAGVTSIAAKIDDVAGLRVARAARILAVQGLLVGPPRAIDGLASLLHTRQVQLPASDTDPASLAPGDVTVDLTVDIGAALAAETGVQLPGLDS